MTSNKKDCFNSKKRHIDDKMMMFYSDNPLSLNVRVHLLILLCTLHF